jgi:hypothetical protein
MLVKQKNINIPLHFKPLHLSGPWQQSHLPSFHEGRQMFVKSSKIPILFTIYEKEEKEEEEEICISIFRKPYLLCSNSQVFFIK